MLNFYSNAHETFHAHGMSMGNTLGINIQLLLYPLKTSLYSLETVFMATVQYRPIHVYIHAT